jgi:glycosyltransferase involved in cell wall biosynthesis
MRVGLDVSLVPGQRAGIGQYAWQLARALAAVDGDTSYRLYPVFYYIVHPEYARAELPAAANVSVAFRAVPPALVRRLWAPGTPGWLKEMALGAVDVLHSTTFCVPRLRRRTPLVVTVYDLSFVTHPEFHLPANVAHCLAGTRAAIERADAIIAISEHTRRDLVERLGAPAERIVVTPLAADPSLAPVTDSARRDAVRRRYRLPERFALFLGALEPRKNLPRLLEAYAGLETAVRRDVRLVVAGAAGWLNDRVHAQVEALGLAPAVHFAGYIETGDVAPLYSLADVLVYPSLYEGFGLPVLEAMACGTPVIASNVAALPEVAADAALLVDPGDVDSLRDALARVLDDAGLRADLARRGRARAEHFSWTRCARQTHALYRSLTGAR